MNNNERKRVPSDDSPEVRSMRESAEALRRESTAKIVDLRKRFRRIARSEGVDVGDTGSFPAVKP